MKKIDTSFASVEANIAAKDSRHWHDADGTKHLITDVDSIGIYRAIISMAGYANRDPHTTGVYLFGVPIFMSLATRWVLMGGHIWVGQDACSLNYKGITEPLLLSFIEHRKQTRKYQREHKN